MKVVFFLSICLLICCKQPDAASDRNLLKGDDEIRTYGAVELLHKNYEDSQFLFIATPNHKTGYRYHLLKRFLEKIGNDKRLKYVVIERPGDADSLYTRLSSAAFETLEANQKSAFIKGLCRSEEWATHDLDLVNYIKRRNDKFPSSRIFLRTIDGVTSASEIEDQKRANNMIDKNGQFTPIPFTKRGCDLKNPLALFSVSASRELQTAQLFEQRIINALQPENKVIVLYHYMHLLPASFRSCFPDFDQKLNQWFTDFVPTSWTTRVFEKNPKLRAASRVILLDEKDPLPKEEAPYNPEGVLKISNTYLTKAEEVGFRLNTHENKTASEELGLNAFYSSFSKLLYEIKNLAKTSLN